MIKKVITVTLVLIAIILVFTNSFLYKNTEEKDDTMKIVTSFYPIYITTKNVTKNVENIEVTNLTSRAVGCLHDYYLLPEEMIALEEADVFIVNGEGMEEFLDDVIKNYPNLKIIHASEGIETISCEHEGHNEINSHVWLSIQNNKIQAENIAKGLSLIDESNKKVYEDNAINYIDKLNQIKRVDLSGKKVVATNETFEYFLEENGAEIVFVLEEEIGTDANIGDIARIIDEIKKEEIDLIVVDSNQEESFYKTIINETKIKPVFLDPITIGNNEDTEYINAMKKNIELMENI